ncbi:MAG TPA: hypothetical protein VMT99_04250 [Candidatus Paceibacterota bacterium]|nr:hypothetical protein [Candidatus Paceibacterota bacterium]
MALETPAGLSVMASTRPETAPPQVTEEFGVVARGRLSHPYRCGHWGPSWFILSVWGERTEKIKQWTKCPDCMIKLWKEIMIRCGVCGRHIFPGDGVALYSGKSDGVRLEIATKVGDSVIGCMRCDCCQSGAFFAGNWSPSGFQPRFGGCTAAEACFATGAAIAADV